jgi:hypothetical protein
MRIKVSTFKLPTKFSSAYFQTIGKIGGKAFKKEEGNSYFEVL